MGDEENEKKKWLVIDGEKDEEAGAYLMAKLDAVQKYIQK